MPAGPDAVAGGCACYVWPATARGIPAGDSVIVVVDYGMGNVGSILNMLRKIGAPACVASGGDALAKADKIVLPGVGAFDAAMGRLAELDIIPLLNQKVLAEKTPILGICLGMQL